VGRIRRQAVGPDSYREVNFKMAENPSKASRRSRVCFVSSFGTRHYFDWIFGILEERAGASPDQWVLVLLPLKGQERIKNVVILLSFLLKEKKQKFKTHTDKIAVIVQYGCPILNSNSS
jgi:hypothetical protein